jgi:hypothetical protein
VYDFENAPLAHGARSCDGGVVAHSVNSDRKPRARRRRGERRPSRPHARLLLDEGRRVFRYETFGDEAFWGDTLKLHQAIAGAKLGGMGPGVSPKTALSVGLKVDVDAVPAALAAALKAGKVDLEDPAPSGKAAATLIPAAFGMAGLNQHTWTGGWGNVTYWNAYVANLELNGRGNFPRRDSTT